MKTLLVLIFSLLIFASCDKIQDDKLTGSWKLEGISGGFSGNGYNAQFMYLIFYDNHKFEYLDSLNNILSSGKYSLSVNNGTNCIKFIKKTKDIFIDSKMKYYIFPQDEVLKLEPCVDECNDCFYYIFSKEY